MARGAFVSTGYEAFVASVCATTHLRRPEGAGGMGLVEFVAALDRSWFTWLNTHTGTPAADSLMMTLANPWMFLAIGIAGFAYRIARGPERREAALLALAISFLVTATDGAAYRVKDWVARPRPCQVMTDARILLPCSQSASLPSNHAANSAALGAFATGVYPRAGIVAVPMVLLVGVSRVWVGTHYPVDVLAGWGIGVPAGLLAQWLWRRRRSRAGSHPSA